MNFTRTLSFFFSLTLILSNLPLSSAYTESITEESDMPVDNYYDLQVGSYDAPLQMEVFDEFQCPYCSKFHTTLNSNEIKDKFIDTGLLHITFYDFSLPFHNNAFFAAQAANAAGRISADKHGAMFDLIFEHQNQWNYLEDPYPVFESYARGLSLDLLKFEKYYLDLDNIAEIKADHGYGNERKITGTPTYFINDKKYIGAYALTSLIEQLELALLETGDIVIDSPVLVLTPLDIKAIYDAHSNELTVIWEIYDSSNISRLTLNYDIFDPSIGPYIQAYSEFDLEIYSSHLIMEAEPNKRYRLTITAYNSLGKIIASKQTSIYTNDYIDEDSPDNEDYACEEYDLPVCLDGWIYYLPSYDGCPGEPVCKRAGGNIEKPIAGYEDEVRVRYIPQENPFSDNDINSLEGLAAAELFYRGVLGGFPDGEFKGNQPVNRAEAAKFLLLAIGYDKLKTALINPFPDVIETEWYGEFVIRAAKLGIIKGHPDGTFRPADGVKRSEFLAMLARTFELELNLPYKFKDEAKYPGEWFWQYAGIEEKYDLFPNGTGYLYPDRAMSRNEVAVAIYQFLKNR